MSNNDTPRININICFPLCLQALGDVPQNVEICVTTCKDLLLKCQKLQVTIVLMIYFITYAIYLNFFCLSVSSV